MVSDITIAQTDITIAAQWQLTTGSIHGTTMYLAANAIWVTENCLLWHFQVEKGSLREAYCFKIDIVMFPSSIPQKLLDLFC